MRRIVITAALSLVGMTLLLFGGAAFVAQRADYGWTPQIPRPTFERESARVLFDEGHHNTSAAFSGRYWPFARLLRADGYAVERSEEALVPAVLERAQILVIANASGAPKPQFFGINLPTASTKRRTDPAFTRVEIDAVRDWVERGGALLLIADHAPFGQAVAALGDAFGVKMNGGFVEVPGESSDPLLFSISNRRLADHPIVRGGRDDRPVTRVMTYTGQSLDGPPGATVLLRLPDTAVEAVPTDEGGSVERPSGRAQAIALEFGKGRVVVLGEGGMATAQVSGGVPYGINAADNDNQQFVLNVMRWLSWRL